MNSKQLITIDLVGDIQCPWCLIGYSRLREAMELNSDKYDFEVQLSPYFIGPYESEKGLTFKEFFATKGMDIDFAKYQGMNGHLTQVGNQLKYKINFAEARPEVLMYNSINAHRVSQYILKKYGKEKQIEFSFYVNRRYFEDIERKDIYKPDVLAEMASELGYDKQEILSLVQDERAQPNKSDIIQQAKAVKESRGIKVVPTYIMNGKHQFNGAEGPASFTEWFKEVALKK